MVKEPEVLTTVTRPGGLNVTQAPFAPSGVVLSISGELDVATLSELHDTLEAVLAGPRERILIDLVDATFIDSVSLAAFVNAKRRLDPRRRLAFAVNPESYATMIFEICGMRSVLDLFDTREQAMAYLRS